MDNGRKNYRQQWGDEIARQFRRAWNGELPLDAFAQLFKPSLVFHFHDRDLHGIEEYQRFMREARRTTRNLDIAEELVLAHGDKVLLFYRWKSQQWHRDIVGANPQSNYCKVVLRVEDGRIAEQWQQAPDYLYLLGKVSHRRVMLYPQVVEESLLIQEEGGIFASDDPQTRTLSLLFKRMNDCFLNRTSLRAMKDIQNEDIVYDTGGTRGRGVQSWKTFAYALHTCLGSQQGTRFEDLYVRDGDCLRVFLRAAVDAPSPYILQCAQGSIAAMKLHARDGKIQSIETQLENYIQFLDTDFTRHPARLKSLFQGQREAVAEAVAAAEDVLLEAPETAVAAAKERVAIVGIAGRFPKCDTVAELWEALVSQRTLFSEIPAQRAYLGCGTDIRHAGYIDDVDRFDAAFFHLLPSEAQFIDPQQRLLLEEIVHSIEDSGHPTRDFAGARTGLFIATLSEDYRKLLQDQGLVNHPHTWAGNENAMFPAKVARFLDIQGPCHFVNAECASSLVAIHEASRLIRDGEIDQAIVGATSLLLHSYGFAVRKGTLLTDEPHARLFSAGSRGQLRGEAIVSVVLKSLSKAVADGDRVYGIVAGSAVNNSGRTLSLVAANVQQQAAAMTAAWQAAGVRPQHISLIECHASGVRGGDFAEIAAIKRALGTGEDPGAPLVPCRISTIKGAVGHAEAASGLTSLVTVLLQLRHGQILGIRGLEGPDPDLRIDPARLDLVAAGAPWPRADGGGAAQPRVAGINGFAAGGYNAHVVIEEYRDDAEAPLALPDCAAAADQVVVLSAQSEASLAAQLRGLHHYLTSRPDTCLADLAVALQQRDAMKHRAAFVVSRVAALLPLLDAALNGLPLGPNVFLGRCGKVADDTAGAHAPPESDPLRTAERWTRGHALACRATPSQRRRRVLDLPLYPFDRRSCWLPESPDSHRPPAAEVLHPLLHRNVSDLSGQRYLTVFSGSEPYLADHVVQGCKVLPGVACLEMVRAAVRDALPGAGAVPSSAEEGSSVHLRHVVWLQPVAIDPADPVAVQVHVELTVLPQPAPATPAAGALPWMSFEIVTRAAGRARVCCRGQAGIEFARPPEPVDLAALQTACNRSRTSAQQVYEAYCALGIDYGPTYRALQFLHVGVDDLGARQVLARLEIPAVADRQDGCVLHPSMMDAAVHAAIGLIIDEPAAADRRLPLPFALERLQVLRPCTAGMWAWIRFSPGADGDARVQKLDIAVLDDVGRSCVVIGGFSSRTGDREPKKDHLALPTPAIAAGAHAAVLADELHDRVLAQLKQKVAQILQVAEDDIDPQEELSEYGFDSISLTDFGNRLNEEYRLPADRPLNPTIFFEYPALGDFTRYLVGTYRDAITARYAAAQPPAGSREAAPAPATLLPAPATSPGHGTPRARCPSLPRAADATSQAPVDANGDIAIAIVGVSGRFPKADDIDALWANLLAGRDCISEVPSDRWDWRALYGNPHKEPHKTDVKWGGFIDGIAEFDSMFFGISPREAELMDPQQRLLMQHVWLAIEDAGHSAQSLSGTRTGVFLATANSGYTGLLTDAGNPIEGSTITGMVPSVGPNRISYLLNLHGPSEPIETACSSSLVAIHRAIVAMQAGTCDMAIVGGVNTLVTPEGHIGFRKAGMICEDGRCKTFSKQANGYVRGEGVGILFLKKLPDAQRSRDPIYAVIKGSAENHGGRANSLTAPNPKAQAELIKAAFTQARIDPRSVGYIEAHGTGTELGDPIEVNGLKSAFGDLYRVTGGAEIAGAHCGLGSVKSNIGHLELAAGVAGVIKVLLQLEHKTLVKSLHSEDINPYVQLHDSPFYVVQENRPWTAPTDAQGRELPRRAGVSAFGFGGANAHVVIEEYRRPSSDAPPARSAIPDSFVIVLSARTGKQLLDCAQRLLRFLQRGRDGGAALSDDDLPDIAYTLQVGREAMEERLGLVATSLDDLRDKLEVVIAGGGDGAADVYQGAVKPHRDALAVFHGDDDLRGAVDAWFAKGKYRKLLQLWVKGLSVDWERLHAAADSRPRRISLPTYPFAKERHWVPKGHAGAREGAPGWTIHPLVHRNTSDFSRQRYSSRFSGQEFFLRDHVVMQRPLLPAVAYLEMVRAAVADAAGRASAGAGICLRNVVWPQPIMLEAADNRAAVTAHVGLVIEQTGEIPFQIHTNPTEDVAAEQTGASKLHCQGVASIRPAGAVVRHDILALKARHTHARHSCEDVYAAFEALGLRYGPSHRALEHLLIAETATAGTEVLAKLRLPAFLSPGLADYVMHPSMLDAGLQAGIGFMLHGAPAVSGGGPPLPFHLKELEVLAPCTASMWAWVRHASADVAPAADRSMQTLDIDLCDESGRVCVRLNGFASRILVDRQPLSSGEPGSAASARHGAASSDEPHGLMLAPVWEPITDLPPVHDPADLLPAPQDRILIVADAAAATALRTLYPHATVVEDFPSDAALVPGALDHVVWIAPDVPLASLAEEHLIEAQERGVTQLFRAIKTLLALGYGARPLAWTFVTSQARAVHEGETPNPTHAGVIGLAGSMAKEYASWKLRIIDLPLGWVERLDDAAPALSLREIFSLPADGAGSACVHRNATWYRQKLAPLRVLDRADAPRTRNSLYKSSGVYLVIGGGGGIGEAWTEYMIRSYQAQVVWIGRRACDDALRSKLERLAAFGPAPLYIQADATRRQPLQAAYDEIRHRFGRINGIVHSAIVLKDQSLANMDETGFRAALSAKIDISVRIAQVFQGEPLDFVLFFSSLVAFARPPGQSNYVAGCTFKDAFAQRLAADWPCAVKVMNWGYWGHVGVAASADYRKRMAQLGVGSIEPAEAMESLEILLGDSLNQTALVNVTKPLAELANGVYASFLSGGGIEAPRQPIPAPAQAKRPSAQPAPRLEDYVIETICSVLSAALKVDASEIDIDEPLAGYGLDSIIGVQLAQTLNETFGLELEVTLFFDYGTVRLLAGHLLSQHADAMAQSCERAAGGSLADAAACDSVPEPAALEGFATARRLVLVPPMPEVRETAVRAERAPECETGVAADGIAIVGVSGCFPMARNAEELWRNLIDGKECIVEVPKERWDWQQLSGDPTQRVDRACFRSGGFIEGIELFDAAFFGVRPEEAMYMSPQQRLLLTHVWKAIEDAGIAPKALSADPTGVFIATVPSEYLNAVSDIKDVPLMVIGLSTSMIPNRISHSLNLRGPSEHCDTACSSTLVALHRAVWAIRNGECSQAIVGAVNLLLTPAGYIGFESMGYLSPVGRMAAFQPEADGFVRAEGVGAVVLKPLQQAIADRNQIYAVIRGTGVSHGGSSVSMTTPNGAGMKEAIRQAYRSSGIDPRTVSYVEAHGIASPLGDAIEIGALKAEYQRLSMAFADDQVADEACFIGSAKPCVGYAEVASGMVSLIKVLMAMRHSILPGVPRFTKLHDNIALGNSRFRITADHQPWQAPIDRGGRALPRRAAINNYGFSGVNAHLVLEQYRAPARTAPAATSGTLPDRQLVVLSARNNAHLEASASQLLDFIRTRDDLSLADVAYTLQVGREPMDCRLAVVAADFAELARGLQEVVDAGVTAACLPDGSSVYVGTSSKNATWRAEAASVDAWIGQQRLHDLARHWVHGGEVPWDRLHVTGSPHRISLPGYPLEPGRFWVPGATGLSALLRQGARAVEREQRRDTAPAA